MSRQDVTLEALREILDRELEKRAPGCEFDGQLAKLDSPAPSGCNWTADDLDVPEECADAAAEVLADALRRYNVSD